MERKLQCGLRRHHILVRFAWCSLQSASRARGSAASRADETRDGERYPHTEIQYSGFGHEQQRHGARQGAGKTEGERDDSVGPYAQQARHNKILSRGTYLDAGPRATKEPDSRGQQYHRHQDGDDVDHGDPDAADSDLLG